MSTAKLIELIKRISHETYTNSAPTDFLIGTVVSTKPLKIKISDKITLEREHLLILKNAIGLYRCESHCSGHGCDTPIHGICYHEISLGDKVILGRSLGGEKFILMGVLE